jgi:hypothetical protein
LTGEHYPNGSAKTRDTDDARTLRDYVRNQAMWDKFDALLDREAAHERRHRRGAPDGFRYPISVRQSAAIIVLSQMAAGADRDAMPPASLFTSCRDTAAEAIVIGYCAREALKADPELVPMLHALDYAAAVRS